MLIVLLFILVFLGFLPIILWAGPTRRGLRGGFHSSGGHGGFGGGFSGGSGGFGGFGGGSSGGGGVSGGF